MLMRQLEYFVAVAREQHFGRAAEACYISQPALSIAIGKLERELNVTLINRGQNFQGLTPEGERLLSWAKQVLANKDQLKAAAAALQSGTTGTLRVGIGPTVSTATAAGFVANFCELHPRATVHVGTHTASEELLRQLRDGEVDAAIGQFENEQKEGLTMLSLYQDPYVLVASERLLPDAHSMTWRDAAKLPLALLTSETGARELIDESFAIGGSEPEPQVETNSAAVLFAQVSTGAWASVIPYTWLHCIPVPDEARVVQLIEPYAHEEISVAVRSEKESTVGTKFLDVVTTAV